MCGRFTATFVDPQRIAQRFGVGGSAIPAETLGRYNVCPTEQVLAVCGPQESRAARDLRWGLVPPWARKLRAGPGADQRARGVAARQAAVRAAAGARRPPLPRDRRRLVRVAATRAPARRARAVPLHGRRRRAVRVRGLWHERRVDGARLASVTVLTTTANAVCSPVHDRMPCVLESAEAEAAWLSPAVDAQAALELLTVLAAARTSAAPANPAVNKAGVEGAELLIAPPRGGAGPARARMSAAGDLVGRGRELAVLDRALDAVAAGGPRFLALVGEPGIGKTSVMERLSELASGRGWLVLAGRAAEFERELPFGVLVDALDDHLAMLDQRKLERAGGERLAELAAIFPSLDGPPVPEGALQAERYRAHRAVQELLDGLAVGRPLLLSLDDLHWADQASLEVVASLLRRPPDGPVLLACSFRPAPAPAFLESALAAAEREGRAERVDLGPLTREDAAELLADIPEPSVRDAVFRISGGNPFYLSQLARLAIHQPVRAATGASSTRSPSASRSRSCRCSPRRCARSRPARAGCWSRRRSPASRSSRTSRRRSARSPTPSSLVRSTTCWRATSCARPTCRASSASAIRWCAAPSTRTPAAAGGWRPTAVRPRRWRRAARPPPRRRTTSSTRPGAATSGRSRCSAGRRGTPRRARRPRRRAGSRRRCGWCRRPTRSRRSRAASSC